MVISGEEKSAVCVRVSRAGMALIIPLAGVFLHDRGIGPDEIALFGFVAALLSFVSRSAFAILADRIGFHRLVHQCVFSTRRAPRSPH